jgi:diguanylate cyclase (GGDEF)-like protein/PAS domain S-box-containing protein
VERATYPGAVYMDLLEQVSDGVYFVSPQRRITYWNSGAERLTGYTAAEVLGRRCSAGLLRHVDDTGGDLCHAGCPLAAVMADGAPRSAEVFLHHKAGHRVAVTVHGHPLTDPDGRVVGSAEVFAERRDRAYADLGRRSADSAQDPVTGLPGRALGELHLATLLAAVTAGQTTLGVMFVDVDHFKDINDSHGHRAGDQVLGMVGRSLATALRRGDLPIRWGGEEFLALLPGVQASGLATAAERVRMLVATSWLDHADTRLQVTVSLGTTMARPGETAAELVERADRLMYQSKNTGRNHTTTDTPPPA